MAGKLNESAWTGFIRKLKLDLDDGPLVKSLARLDKADDAKARAVALEDAVEQIKKQVVLLAKRKKELGDKIFDEVKDKLHELLGLAEAQLKDARADAAQADEEDADSPALLTGKMIPLLRQLRKGGVTMPALICTAGRNTAVLIMRRAIAPSRRKLLAEMVDAKGGAKYITGECVYEDNTLTFVVASQAAGLSKRIREALLLQTDLRFKVKVRGDDGEEQDGEDESSESPDEAAAPDIPAAPPLPSAEQLTYVQRLRRVNERVEEALRGQHPEATKLRAVTGFAAEKAAAGDFAGAIKALDIVEKLLGGAPSTSSAAPSAAPTPERSVPSVASVVFQQSRLVWDATRKKAHAELKMLQDAIRADFKGEPEFAEVDALAGRLDALLERFDERLSDKLDEALNAAAPADRQARQREAAAILAEYRAFVDGDEGLRLLDANPFAPVTIRKVFVEALTVLGSKLAG